MKCKVKYRHLGGILRAQVKTLWQTITRTRYTRSLEAEVARLRDENKALLNSILGVAGIPPILVSEPTDTARPTSNSAQLNARAGASSVAPLRRRSWQQINRMLEIHSARKADENQPNDAPAVRTANQ